MSAEIHEFPHGEVGREAVAAAGRAVSANKDKLKTVGGEILQRDADKLRIFFQALRGDEDARTQIRGNIKQSIKNGDLTDKQKEAAEAALNGNWTQVALNPISFFLAFMKMGSSRTQWRNLTENNPELAARIQQAATKLTKDLAREGVLVIGDAAQRRTENPLAQGAISILTTMIAKRLEDNQPNDSIAAADTQAAVDKATTEVEAAFRNGEIDPDTAELAAA